VAELSALPPWLAAAPRQAVPVPERVTAASAMRLCIQPDCFGGATRNNRTVAPWVNFDKPGGKGWLRRFDDFVGRIWRDGCLLDAARRQRLPEIVVLK
jgi:hypothetical protein